MAVWENVIHITDTLLLSNKAAQKQHRLVKGKFQNEEHAYSSAHFQPQLELGLCQSPRTNFQAAL